MNQFFNVGNQVYPISRILKIDCGNIEELSIEVYVSYPDALEAIEKVSVEGINAIDLLLLVKPSALEGRHLRFIRHSWFIHNMFGHPLMQILAVLGLRKWAMWMHEATVPRPLSKIKRTPAGGDDIIRLGKLLKEAAEDMSPIRDYSVNEIPTSRGSFKGIQE